MKAVDKRKQNWRVVKTPTRQEGDLPSWVKGLQLSLDPELIDMSCVSDVDGFVIYSGLWRKDWNLVNSNVETMDNITTVAKADCEECPA